jgi:5-methylthioadenosine/S-adenosylhomocysteine deaminase
MVMFRGAAEDVPARRLVQRLHLADGGQPHGRRRVLMRDRRLLTVDVPAVLDELRPRLVALTDRSHGRRIQDYTT